MKPQKPSSNTNKKWLIPGTLVLLAIASIPLLVWFVAPGKNQAGVKGQLAADEFLGLIRKGSIDQAWSSTNADFKSYMGKESLRALVKRSPALKEATLAPKPAGNESEREAFEYTSAKTGKTIRVGVTLENGVAKVESLSVN